MCPFPGTHVIHPEWAAHHRPTAVGTLPGTCTITTGTGGAWAPESGLTEGTATTLYAGPCSFTDLRRSAQPTDAAGAPLVEHPYLVGIDPSAAGIPAGARVTITASPEDPRAVGLVLVVASFSYDSTGLERVLTCELPASGG